MKLSPDIIRNSPSFIQTLLLRILYWRNGLNLNSFERQPGGYYIYNVQDWNIPSETLSWYLSFEQQLKWVKEVSCLYYLPKTGDIVMDIGAGLGEECGIYSKLVGPAGKVYAIEANPTVFRVLSRCCSLNKLGNIKLFQKAIGLENGTCTFSVSGDLSIGGGLAEKGALKYQVDSTRMETFLEEENIEHIDYLKVNIEGAERYVIDTFGRHIEKVRHIAISCHDFRYDHTKNAFFKTRAIVENFLLEKGFHIEPDREDRKYVDWVYARNKNLDHVRN